MYQLQLINVTILLQPNQSIDIMAVDGICDGCGTSGSTTATGNWVCYITHNLCSSCANSSNCPVDGSESR